MAPDKKSANKRKRPYETPEQILARPWCYYCDRDFDDLRILVDHQKAKHFQCISNGCHRRLNTVGGLKVHMQQVHKEELLEVPNAIEGRKDLSVEIFGVEGIPPELVQKRREVFLAAVHKEQVEYFKLTGNPLPGTVKHGDAPPPAKKVATETKESIKAKAQAAKAKLLAKRAAHAAGAPYVEGQTPTPAPASQPARSAIDDPEPVPLRGYMPQPQKPNETRGEYSPVPILGSPPAHATAQSGYPAPGQHSFGSVTQSSSPVPVAAHSAYPPPGHPMYGAAPQSSSPIPVPAQSAYSTPGQHMYGSVPQNGSPILIAAQSGYAPPGQPFSGSSMANGFPAMGMQHMHQNMTAMPPGMSSVHHGAPSVAPGMPSHQMPSGSPTSFHPYSSSPINGSNLPGLGGPANLPRRPNTGARVPLPIGPQPSGPPYREVPTRGQVNTYRGDQSGNDKDNTGDEWKKDATAMLKRHLETQPNKDLDRLMDDMQEKVRQYNSSTKPAINEELDDKQESQIKEADNSTLGQTNGGAKKDATSKSKKDSKKKKDGEMSKQLLSDDTISWEEKRAMAPRYARMPITTTTVMGDANDAVTGVVDSEMS